MATKSPAEAAAERQKMLDDTMAEVAEKDAARLAAKALAYQDTVTATDIVDDEDDDLAQAEAERQAAVDAAGPLTDADDLEPEAQVSPEAATPVTDDAAPVTDEAATPRPKRYKRKATKLIDKNAALAFGAFIRLDGRMESHGSVAVRLSDREVVLTTEDGPNGNQVSIVVAIPKEVIVMARAYDPNEMDW